MLTIFYFLVWLLVMFYNFTFVYHENVNNALELTNQSVQCISVYNNCL